MRRSHSRNVTVCCMMSMSHHRPDDHPSAWARLDGLDRAANSNASREALPARAAVVQRRSESMSAHEVVTVNFGPVTVRPLSPAVGGEVVGLDLSRPLSQATYDGLRAAWDRYALLLFRGQG